jgi:hypothetical protein
MQPLPRRPFAPLTILATVLLLLVCPFVVAQQGDRPARVVVAVVPGTDADPAYQAVLRDALIVNLTRNRMSASAADAPDGTRAAARENKADYLILGTWSNTSETLDLVVELWLQDGDVPLATGKATGRIGLTLDSVAGEALARILPAMQARFPADAGSIGDGTGRTTTTPSGSVEVTGGTAGGSTGTMTVVGPSNAGAGTQESPQRWRRVELSFGGAPLVNTGDVAEYAKIGASVAIDIDFRFPVGSGALAPGLAIGGSWFRASGIGVADILVIPVGPDLHWTIAAGTDPGVSLHVAAGPAGIVAITSWANTVWKISPFVGGGIDVDIGLTPALGLRVEAVYLLVFEGSMVLQAFTPRISLRTRF